LAGLAGVVLTAWGPAGRAQDATTTTTTTDTTTTTSPQAMTAADLGTGVFDYNLINNPLYDYTDLKAAQARGYTDSEIATMLKIARLSDQPFKLIAQKVEVGYTFAKLAQEYNLRLDDIMDVSDDQARLETYLTTYESLGSMGRAKYGMMSSASTGPDTELDRMIAQWNQEYAAFPSTDFGHLNPIPVHAAETTTTTTTQTETTTAVVAPPPVPAPTEAPPAPTETTIVTPAVREAPVRRVRHHHARHVHHRVARHHRRVRRHRRLPVYMYRGS
jgi:hypothetical protein